MKTFTSVLLAGCLISPVAMADSCRYSRDINFDVPVNGLEQVDIDVGAGYLEIRGAPAANEISVRARACASTQDQLDEMDLSQSRRGNRLDISSEINSTGSPFTLFGTRYAYIDVDISLPAGLSVNIEDGSGDIRIEDVSANLEIDDGSGDIIVSNLIGDIEVDDGSGDVELETITGAVRIQDGSGDIRLDVIQGDVHMPDDGSGSIRVQNVTGNVTVDDDGSGDIDVHDVTGDFVARDTGSGDVDHSGIGGRVDVRD